MNGWVKAISGDSLVNLAHVVVVSHHVSGRAGLQLPDGDVVLSDEPFEAIRDRLDPPEEPKITSLDPETGVAGYPKPWAPPCGAQYGSDSSPCTRPRGHFITEALPHRCYDPYGRGHWVDFIPKPGGPAGEWLKIDEHEALKR